MKIFECYYLIKGLRIAKFLYDAGVFESALTGITWLDEEDYMELFLNGISVLTPIFEIEDLGNEVCCGGHVLYHFSDPAMLEYYRLCRLYEHKYSIKPKDNPYVERADEYYTIYCNKVEGNFSACFDDDVYTRELQIETCPDYPLDELGLLICIHNMLEFYRREVIKLKNEMMRDPMVFLPALPEFKGDIAYENAA